MRSAAHSLDTQLYRFYVNTVKSVNALTLRQSLGQVLKALQRDGAPILVEQRGKPAAALISMKDFRERFVDRDADESRRAAVARLKELNFARPEKGKTTLDVLRKLRAGRE